MNILVKNNTKGLPYLSYIAIALAALLIIPGIAFAQQTLPYEGGLATFRESMQGPVPFIISLAGIVGCGAMLIFGGEISGFLRTMVFIVLVVAVIVQAENVIGMLGGSWEGMTAGLGTPNHVTGVASPSIA